MRVDKLWYSHIIEYNIPIKKDGTTNTKTPWINFKTIMLNNGSQTHNNTYCMIQFI